MSDQLLRRAQVYALWNSSLDWLPGIRGSIDTSAAGAHGFVSGRRVPCGRCRGTGRVRGHGETAFACQQCLAHPGTDLRHGCLPCLLCDATGWRLTRRGEAGEDEYRKPSKTGLLDEANVRVDRKQARDAEIARLQRTLALHDAAFDDDEAAPDWWLSYALREKERLYKHGDYAPLDAVMHELRQQRPLEHSLVTKVEVYGEPIHVSQRTRDLIDATADWVAARMPDPMTVPNEYQPSALNEAAKDSHWRGRTPAHEMRRRARDERVLRAHLEWGWSAKQIAAHESLSERRVRQLLAGELAAIASGPAA